MSPAHAASADEVIAIGLLLQEAGLPIADLATARPEFLAICEDGKVLAAGALQRFASSALLRSIVVSHDRRGSGLGGAIVAALERRAREASIERLILLTDTAATFFAFRGYQVIARSSAPTDMQQCEEFRSLCPSSATCMAKSLQGLA